MTAAIREKIEEQGLLDLLTVASGQSVGQGIPVVAASGEITPVTDATTNATHIAYISEDGVWPATAGDLVTCVALGSPVTVPAKVGTGGCTYGAFAAATSDGSIDTTPGGGTALNYCLGKWRETGLVGDLRGLYLGAACPIVHA